VHVAKGTSLTCSILLAGIAHADIGGQVHQPIHQPMQLGGHLRWIAARRQADIAVTIEEKPGLFVFIADAVDGRGMGE